jgi:hypothetical protein
MPRSVPEAVPVNLLSTYSNPYLESDLFKLMASRESAFGPTYIERQPHIPNLWPYVCGPLIFLAIFYHRRRAGQLCRFGHPISNTFPRAPSMRNSRRDGKRTYLIPLYTQHTFYSGVFHSFVGELVCSQRGAFRMVPECARENFCALVSLAGRGL